MRPASFRYVAALAALVLLGAIGVVTAHFLMRRNRPDTRTVDLGRRIFVQRCAVCHVTGMGAGQGVAG